MSTVDLRETSRHDRRLNALSMTAVALAALLLYSRAVDFAFFNDDPTGHFAWMASRSPAEFFSSAADYGYYRPVVFTTLQGLVAAVGYNPALFHGLLIGLHAANVALLWLLAKRLGASRPYAWTAALIFATAPFSYEAVAYVASLTHPLLLFWLLLTLLLYQNARAARSKGARRAYDLAANVTLMLGLLSHENGLFIVPALIGVEWLRQPPQSLGEGLKRPFLPYFIAPVLYLLLWLAIPKASEQGLASFGEWASNMLPFIQTLVYPLLPVISLTAEQGTALLLLAVLALAALYGTARVGRRVPLWLFGLGWFLLSALPATLFLTPDYLYGSPRLQYLSSVGVALLWALPVPALLGKVRSGWRQVAIDALGVAYTLAMIVPPLTFVRCELDFYAEGSSVVRQMVEIARGTPADQALTLVNVPFFFSSYAEHPQGCLNPYPWTPVGTVVVPPYAAARDFVRFNGGPDREVTAVTVDAFAPGWSTHGEELEASMLRERVADGAVQVFDLPARGFFDLGGAWQLEESLMEATAAFGPGLALVGTTVSGSPDGEIEVDLRWQVTRPWAKQPAVFVHLYDAGGALIAQHDGPPGGPFLPAAVWEQGDVLVDRHGLRLPADLSAGKYAIGVGLYDPVTGERYRAEAAGQDLAENVLVIERLMLP